MQELTSKSSENLSSKYSSYNKLVKKASPRAEAYFFKYGEFGSFVSVGLELKKTFPCVAQIFVRGLVRTRHASAYVSNTKTASSRLHVPFEVVFTRSGERLHSTAWAGWQFLHLWTSYKASRDHKQKRTNSEHEIKASTAIVLSS